jgi:glycosidase
MKPVIYQLFVRVFGNKTPQQVYSGTIEENGCGKFADINQKALQAIASLGTTHIWYTGVIAHACSTDYAAYGIPRSCPGITKGRAGSPYAIRDYYDVDPDLANDAAKRMAEFESLIKRTRKAGMKVLIDFVGNHVARQYKETSPPGGVRCLGAGDNPLLAFSPANDFYYLPGQSFRLPEQTEPWGDRAIFDIDLACYEESPARATGNDCFTAHPAVTDWYETVKLNYGVDYLNGMTAYFEPRPPLWDKMCDILLFWAGRGVDGFRCDMAGMVPPEFWEYAIRRVKEIHHDVIFIAEIYEPERYRQYLKAGFDYLYDKEGMYNILFGILKRGEPAAQLTGVWQGLQGLEPVMLRFIENHDEVRVAASAFAGNAMAGIPAMLLATAMHTGPVMIYNGQETGEYAEGAAGFSGDDGRTSIFDYTTMPLFQRWMGKGSFDGQSLFDWQRVLLGFYRDFLPLVISSPAVQSGAFYDLMWVNQNHPAPDTAKIYAWLRHTEEQKLLFLVNFDGEHTHYFRLFIPLHAFEIMGLPANDNYCLTRFASEENFLCYTGYMAAYDGLELSLPPLGYAVYRLTKS